MSEICPIHPANDNRTTSNNGSGIHLNTERNKAETLVFSTCERLKDTPAGYAAEFKMLHMQTGQLYIYRLCVTKIRYEGRILSQDKRENDKRWQQRMFFGLTEFIDTYYREYGCFPSPSNIYHDGRCYSDSGNFFGKRICFKVPDKQSRSMEDNQFIISL